MQETDGQVLVSTTPTGANVTLDGTYQGQTPLELALAPDSAHSISLSKAGYQRVTRSIKVKAEEEKQLNVQLKANLGSVKLVSRPDGAVVYVDGTRRGSANQHLRLTAVPHVLEIKKNGYASQKLSVTPRPGFEQELSVTLKTLAQHETAATPVLIKTHAGQELRLIKPGQFTMGASRREQGRRANEVRYPVRLTRPFYLGTQEVTNAQFRQFQATHSSGIVQNISLDIDSRPVVRVSWEQAVHYCNWLSRQDGLSPFYVENGGKLVAAQPLTLGYRLPTEAEWAWAARFAGGAQSAKFPWGKTLPPAAKSGNYADESADNLIADTLNGYNDGYPATAPVGTYVPNSRGLFDFGGNVAEWIHDYYSFGPNQTTKPSIDPMGPANGQHHVIRGSSWMHASISELRLTYRDYGDKFRPDVGFRIARYAQ
jgi:formylglycine-generating enzyme required for sulfatase activity